MKKGVLFFITLCLTLPSYGQTKFAPQEVKEDLRFLRKSLEEAHYNLYTYITKEAFEENYAKAEAFIGADSLSLLEITSLFQSVISKANNGHTEIFFPSAVYGEYAASGGTLFPLEIAFESGKALVRKNWSGNNTIEIGSEILRINGKSIEEILQNIYPLISAERRYFKLAKIELISFPRLYWQAFGEAQSFEVEIQQGGVKEIFKLNSVKLIEDFEMKRSEIFANDRGLKLLTRAAYLRPGNFSGDEKEYKAFIDSSFAEIKQSKTSKLIIDLRNNLGGNDSYSDYLVSYIADKPFRWNSEFTLKTSDILKEYVRANYDTTALFWRSVLDNPSGSIYPYEFEVYQPQAEEARFSGEVYVLVNRQSHSQSAVTAAQIQDYNFAVIVGEETGDFPSLLASQYSYNLPNTGIEVKISKGYIVRLNGSKKAEGVLPDIYIKDHLLDEEDEILEGLLEMIEE